MQKYLQVGEGSMDAPCADALRCTVKACPGMIEMLSVLECELE